jgi:hypothetical protein
MAEPAGNATQRKEGLNANSAGTIEDLGNIIVEGHIQKPAVFYVLSRSDTHYRLPIRHEDFVPRILRSVEDNPF